MINYGSNKTMVSMLLFNEKDKRLSACIEFVQIQLEQFKQLRVEKINKTINLISTYNEHNLVNKQRSMGLLYIIKSQLLCRDIELTISIIQNEFNLIIEYYAPFANVEINEIINCHEYRIKQCQLQADQIHDHIKQFFINLGMLIIIAIECHIIRIESSSSQQQDCTICLEYCQEYSSQCGHWYHSRCINRWYKISKQCPVCRAELMSHPIQPEILKGFIITLTKKCNY